MRPFFFGDSEAPLWGVLHEPSAEKERDHGVLLCPPIGHEYVRCHWALRQIAAALAKAGFATLRFDWFGVGDSAGDLADGTVERWLSDVELAVEELKDTTGIRTVSLLGVRFGAALAALAAKTVRPARLVLWDPITSGESYVAQLFRIRDLALNDDKRFWSLASRGPKDRPGETEIVGQDASPELLRSVGKVTGERLRNVPKCRVLYLYSEPDAGAQTYADDLARAGCTVTTQSITTKTLWTDPKRVDELFLPADAPLAVTRFFEEPR